MTRPIDEKIVAMKMDNSDFKQKAVETTNIFGKLRDSLNRIPGVNVDKMTRGFGDISRAAGNVDMAGLARNVESVASRFSTLGVMATTALVNITNRAVDAGLAMAKSFTIAPIMDGFNEYETKMGSIQTILANTSSKGTTLEDVKKSLNELNLYADRTIYSFSDMTRNIGLFTNAGLGLKESTSMIKGFSNAAAASGTNAENAARAAYQLSQGLTSGYIIQMDWMSLTNAGMGNDNMKRDLIAIGHAMGTLGASTQKTMANWKEYLTKKKWLTKDVMSTYLQAMAGDLSKAQLLAKGLTSAQADILLKNAKIGNEAATYIRTFTQLFGALKEGIGSGWATTWELVIGDFNVATKRLTALSNVLNAFFNKQANARNKFVKSMADAGVFDDIFYSITNGGRGVLKIFDALGKGFRLAFPPKNVKDVKDTSEGFKSFSASLIPTQQTLENIAKVSQAIFSTLNSGMQVIVGLGKALVGMIPPGLGPAIMDILGSIAKTIVDFATSETTLRTISTIFNTISFAIRTAATEALNLGEALIAMIPPGLVNDIGNFFEKIADIIVSFATSQSTLNAIAVVIHGLFVVIKVLVGAVLLLGKALLNLIPPDLGTTIIGLVQKFFNFLTNLTRMIPPLDTISISGIKMDSTLKRVHSTISGMGAGIASLSIGFNDLGGAISQAWSVLSKGAFSDNGPWKKDSKIISWLFKIRAAFQSITKYVSSLHLSLKPVVSAFTSFFKLIGEGYQWVKAKLIGVKDAIAKVMPSGTKMFAGGFMAAMIATVGLVLKMSWDMHKMFMGFGKIGESVSGVLDSVSESLERLTGGGNSRAMTILAIAVAMGVLALSLKMLSTVKAENVWAPLVSIVSIMGALIGAMAIINKYDIKGAGMKAAITMVGISVAVMLMAKALKDLSSLSWSEIGVGITGLIATMATLSGAMVLMSKFAGGGIGASALQFIALAFTIRILMTTIQEIAKVDTGVLQKGLLVMGAILLEMGAFMWLVGKSKFGIGSTLGMLAMGKAIVNIVNAIKVISNMDQGALKSGLKTLAVIFLEVGLFSRMIRRTNLLTAGVGMFMIAAAVTALIVPLSILGNMDIGTLAQGLGALSVMLLAIGVASKLMTGMVLTGAGLILFAIGLTALLVPLTIMGAMSWGVLIKGMVGLAGVMLIVGGASLLLSEAVVPLIGFGIGVGLLGVAMLAAGLGMSLFATGLVTLATMTAASITAIVSTLAMLIAGLTSLIPMAVEFVLNIIVAILNAIAGHMPDIIKAGVKIIVNLIDGLAQGIPKIIESAVKLMIAFIDGLAKTIDEYGPKLVSAILKLVGAILNLLINAGGQVVIALFGWIPGVKKAVTEVSKTAEDTIRDTFGAYDAGSEKGKEFSEGLSSTTPEAKTAGAELGKSSDTGAKLVDLFTTGSQKGQDFGDGLSQKYGYVDDAGTSVAEAGKKGAASVSMMETGKNFGLGFADGMTSETSLGHVHSAGQTLAWYARNSVKGAAQIQSPSRVAMKLGNFFGEGFAIGITDKAKSVGESAKKMAVNAKASLNEFITNFDPRPEDNELHFKAVIDYSQFDARKFGQVSSLSVTPDITGTTGLIPQSVKPSVANPDTQHQNGDNSEIVKRQEQQIGILQKQIELLSHISTKDNSLYLDGRELYKSNKRIQNDSTNIRNVFKGVTTV